MSVFECKFSVYPILVPLVSTDIRCHQNLGHIWTCFKCQFCILINISTKEHFPDFSQLHFLIQSAKRNVHKCNCWNLSMKSWVQAFCETVTKMILSTDVSLHHTANSTITLTPSLRSCLQQGSSIAHACKIAQLFFSFFFCHLPTNKVSYNIGMANDDFNTVSFLFWISTMEVLAEGRFNASIILIKLLHRIYTRKSSCTHYYGHYRNIF